MHIAFTVDDRAAVDPCRRARAFYDTRSPPEAQPISEPGVMVEYHRDHHRGFVLDPDGINVEAACHHAGMIGGSTCRCSSGEPTGGQRCDLLRSTIPVPIADGPALSRQRSRTKRSAWSRARSSLGATMPRSEDNRRVETTRSWSQRA